MIFSKLHSIFFLCLSLILFSQENPPQEMLKDEYGREYYYDNILKAKVYMIDGEKLVIMDEMLIMPKPKFNNQLDRNYYYFINKRLARVYPLFLTALEQYRTLQIEIQNLKGNEKRKFIKTKQEQLANEYEAKLRDLTTSEGRIFAKLMSRATGKTVYEIIRELRGGWSAFWWNVKGNVADVDIKEEYNPRRNRDDEYLEHLLVSNWRLGYFKPYKGYETYSINVSKSD